MAEVVVTSIATIFCISRERSLLGRFYEGNPFRETAMASEVRPRCFEPKRGRRSLTSCFPLNTSDPRQNQTGHGHLSVHGRSYPGIRRVRNCAGAHGRRQPADRQCARGAAWPPVTNSSPAITGSVTTAKITPLAPMVTFLAASLTAGDVMQVAWNYTQQPWCTKALDGTVGRWVL